METRRALLVDAFADEPLAGEPAGVVPDAEGLTADQRLAVARELGASETAFIHPASSADRRLRTVTPTGEVEGPGHATVAAHAVLHEEGAVDAGTHTLETEGGRAVVEVEDDGRVWTTQGDPTVTRIDLDRDRVAEALGVDAAVLDVDGLPLATASVGRPVLVVPVRLLEHLSGAWGDREALTGLVEAADAEGLYAFTFDTLESASTLHGRPWAPGADAPGTVAASGAVGAYLEAVDAFDAVPDPMRFEQGHLADRPGQVLVRLGEAVQVGGRAVTALDGTLVVPDADDGSDIIEP